MDEENGDKNHPELWLRFGEAVGTTREEIQNAHYSSETNSFVNNFKSITADGSVAEGIGALYAYESQIPKVSEEKINGLVNLYGVKGEEGLEYFKVHMEADIGHSQGERELLLKYANEENQNQVLDAVDKTLDAYWEMLTGIHGNCMSC